MDESGFSGGGGASSSSSRNFVLERFCNPAHVRRQHQQQQRLQNLSPPLPSTAATASEVNVTAAELAAAAAAAEKAGNLDNFLSSTRDFPLAFAAAMAGSSGGAVSTSSLSSGSDRFYCPSHLRRQQQRLQNQRPPSPSPPQSGRHTPAMPAAAPADPDSRVDSDDSSSM